MPAELSPELVFTLAVVKARLKRMRARERAEFLKDLDDVLTAWETGPTPIRLAGSPRANAEAAELYRAMLPRLLG